MAIYGAQSAKTAGHWHHLGLLLASGRRAGHPQVDSDGHSMRWWSADMPWYAIEMSHKSWIYPKICPDLRTSLDIPQTCFKYEQKSKNVGETWQRWGVNSLRTTIWGCFCWWNMGIQLDSTNMRDSAPPIQHYRYKAVPHTYLSWFIIPCLGVW